ncbi:Acetyl esterase/lipase [Jatrophihabitans endophyticus]|uniref:Acetyl esterase/lipase n=1 Tax=Jatrophihabitans endophyticus TaxID=1206085 RepID=A0A1M5ULB4_9ACTN|nr:alpha/beta hydrolase [Jatrophihabitans endophyticus]SHH63852.1 Acetyl esterase/lipase [Jatrophihabitans endophyticus]
MRAADLVLGLNAAAALNAVNARRPLDRRHRASIPAFLAGWATSELPLQTLGVHAAANVAAFAAGGNRGLRGAVGLGLSAVTAGELLATHRSARRAADVYERALAAALGAGYRDAVVQPEHPGPAAADAHAPGLVRMTRIRRRFAHHADIAYGPAGHANLLDVWARDDLPADANAPVLVQVPGGAWVTGNKQAQAYPLMSHLAERGWVCVAVNYRLSPRATWPDQIVDVKRALAWVKRTIREYGGDPGFVAITGGSAGGHLSSLAALTPHERAWQPGFEDVDTSVAAAVPFYGAYDWVDAEDVGHRGLPGFVGRHVVKASPRAEPETFRRASPLYRVHAGAPPFLLSHGTNDSVIPVEQGRLFAQRLRAVSRQPVAYAELPGAQHAFDFFGSTRANLAAEAVARFLGWVYGRHLAAAGRVGSP